MGVGEFNAGGNLVMNYILSTGRRDAPTGFMALRQEINAGLLISWARKVHMLKLFILLSLRDCGVSG